MVKLDSGWILGDVDDFRLEGEYVLWNGSAGEVRKRVVHEARVEAGDKGARDGREEDKPLHTHRHPAELGHALECSGRQRLLRAGQQHGHRVPQEEGVEDHGGGEVGRQAVLRDARDVTRSLEVVVVKAGLDHVPT